MTEEPWTVRLERKGGRLYIILTPPQASGTKPRLCLEIPVNLSRLRAAVEGVRYEH